MVSVRDYPEIVEKYQADEVAAGRLLAVGSKEMVARLAYPAARSGLFPRKRERTSVFDHGLVCT